MTDDLKKEWCYLYIERLGMICGSDDPTPEQNAIAREEADRAIEELRKKERVNDKLTP